MDSTRPPAKPDRLGHLLDAEQSAELAGTLSTWRTVDRRDVHKAATAEVLVTDVVEVSPDLTVFAAQWPRAHPTFQPDVEGRPHPLLFVETLRQAAMCVAHRELGVPRGQHFIFQRIAARWSADVPPPPGDRPPTVVLAVRTSPRYAGMRMAGADVEGEAWAGDACIATARAAYRCLSPSAYARLRVAALARATAAAARRPPSPDPDGCRRPGTRVSRLHVDAGNPTFFDHPSDHLPGMLLISEVVGAGAARFPWAADTGLAGLEIEFGRFAELGLPTALVTQAPVDAPAQSCVRVGVEQADEVVARAVMSFREQR
jgi:hypothetical protein